MADTAVRESGVEEPGVRQSALREPSEAAPGTNLWTSTPRWAWGFAAVCALLPFVTLGGFVPAAMGIGGAAASLAIARESKFSPKARVAACVVVALLCWGLTFGMIFALWRMQPA